jgi:predicted acylesterase/phospholipase RssA
MQLRQILAILATAFALSACVGERPDGAMCPAPSQKDVLAPAYGASIASAMQGKWDIPAGRTREHVDILVLSGGGAWGAYGAGFLNGWSARDASLGGARPQFDVVTGVSTGAIIAPFALLGPDYDATLKLAYRGVASEDLFERRSILGLPFWNSFNDPKPIEQGLYNTLTDPAIAGLAKAYAQRRSLWAGAVNFDSGGFTEFNLTALAQDLPADKARQAIVTRMMAASAIPGYFPPRFIDGCMYMDGGVRENLFVSQIGGAIDAAIGSWRARKDAVVDIYAIVNGPMAPRRHLTDNTLVDVGIRGFELAADQIQIASLREVYDYAHANGFNLYWTSADDVIAPDAPNDGQRCKAPTTTTDQFDAAFTACLFDAGQNKAQTSATPWRTDRP